MALVSPMISPLQLYVGKYSSGLADTKQVISAYQDRPQDLGAFLSYAFAEQRQSILPFITGGLGNVDEVTNVSGEFEWSLQTQNERSIALAKPVSIPTPGLRGSTFQATFLENLFEAGDNIASDSGFMLTVLDNAIPDGQFFTHTLRVMSGDPTKFLPAKDALAGSRYSKEWMNVDEGSTHGTGTSYSHPYKFRSHLGILRKSYSVTRNAAQGVMYMKMYGDPANPKKTTNMWSHMVDWNNLAAWYEEQDRYMLYSESNRTPNGTFAAIGQSAREVKIPAGVREQIPAINKRYYTELTVEFLMDFLQDLSTRVNYTGGSVEFLGLAGDMGMRMFDAACQKRKNELGLNIVMNSGQFITGTGQELKLTGRFTSIDLPNGIKLTMKHFAGYDDNTRRREQHPVTKRPLESYRITFMNIGKGGDGKGNVVKMIRPGGVDLVTEVAGMVGKDGKPAKNGASGFDGYTMHFLSEMGVRITDPLSCGELIYSIA